MLFLLHWLLPKADTYSTPCNLQCFRRKCYWSKENQQNYVSSNKQIIGSPSPMVAIIQCSFQSVGLGEKQFPSWASLQMCCCWPSYASYLSPGLTLADLTCLCSPTVFLPTHHPSWSKHRSPEDSPTSPGTTALSQRSCLSNKVRLGYAWGLYSQFLCELYFFGDRRWEEIRRACYFWEIYICLFFSFLNHD